MVKNKKAYVRTIEALAAIIITFLFIAYVVPKHSTAGVRESNIELLQFLEKNDDFRNCVFDEDEECASLIIEEYLDSKYDFEVSISNNPNFVKLGLPDKEIFVDSIYIAGSNTLYKPLIVKLYYWKN